jgi:addiction module HigA family antidote
VISRGGLVALEFDDNKIPISVYAEQIDSPADWSTRTKIKRPASGWKFERVTTHPGQMLREEFLLPLGITQNALAMKMRVPATRIGDIVHGRRAVTPDTALRLAQFFGNSPEIWLNLQQMHDLSKARLELSKTIERDVEAYAGA